MNVQQLIKKLQLMPADMEVVICQSDMDFTYAPVENCDVKPVVFMSPDVPKNEWATVDSVIITDEI